MGEEPRIQSGRDSIQAGGDVFQIAGDYVAGDKITYIVQRSLPVNLRSLVQPLIEHYAVDVFGGRDAELAALDAFLADSEHPFGLLVAPTGLGKTALLVHWIARVQQRNPQWRIVFAPVSIRFQTASEQVVLRLLAHSLAEIHNDLEQFCGYDQSPSNLRALIADYLRRPLPTDTRLLIVLDGVDEAISWTVGPLCAVPPQQGLKIVVAARRLATTTWEDWCQQLGWTTAEVMQFNLQRLERSTIESLLKQNTPTLAIDSAFVTQFFRVSEGDPLTSNFLIKALKSGQITPEALTRRPPGLETFLKDWVETLRKRRREGREIRELLALCAVAYGPLTSDDLQALAPEVFANQTDIVDAVSDDEVARFIITVGEAHHTYVFSHQRLREVFLEQIYPPKDRDLLQQRLIAYGTAWYAYRTQPLPDYLRQFWVLHLKDAGQWDTLRQVLTEIVLVSDGTRYIQPWQVARYAAEGNDTGYLSDLDLLWDWADNQGNLGLALRCALIGASLRSRSGNLTSELLVQLVTVGTPEGRWSAAAALEQIASMPDADRQAKCIAALLDLGITLSIERALEIACAIPADAARAQALAALAFSLANKPALLGDVLAATHTINDETYRTQLLVHLAPTLASAPALLPNALAAVRTIKMDSLRAKALTALTPQLPADLQFDVLVGIRAIKYEYTRARLLASLAPQLPPDQKSTVLAEALTTAGMIKDKEDLALALKALAAQLLPDQQPSVLADALAAACAIEREGERALQLKLMAPALASTPALLTEALAVARAIQTDYVRVQTLAALAAQLPPEQQLNILADTLATACAIRNEFDRVRAFRDLVPVLASTPALLLDALTAAYAFQDDDARNSVLVTLIPALASTTALLPDALAAARAIRDEKDLAQALVALAPKLPADQQAGILIDTFTVARDLRDGLYRAEALIALAPQLSPDQQPRVLAEALDAVRTIRDEEDMARALAAFARQLPPAQQLDALTDALAAASTIRSDYARAETLAALAPQLPPEQQSRVLSDALAAARAIKRKSDRMWALMTLIPIVARMFALMPDVQDAALAAVRTIEIDHTRARLLATLAAQLPANRQGAVLAEALAAARAIRSELELAELLPAFVGMPALLPDVLATARAIRDEFARAYALWALALKLPPDQQPSVLADALAAACAIRNEVSRDSMLSNLAPALASMPVLIPDALAAAHASRSEITRAEVLATLTPNLPPDQRAYVLAEALVFIRAVRNDDTRAKALATLASQLPSDEQSSVLPEALAAAHIIKLKFERKKALVALAPALANSPSSLSERKQPAGISSGQCLKISKIESFR